MSCQVCGKPIRRGEKFILVGVYPSYLSKVDYVFVGGLWKSIGPEKFGEIYHEACYLELLANLKQETRKVLKNE